MKDQNQDQGLQAEVKWDKQYKLSIWLQVDQFLMSLSRELGKQVLQNSTNSKGQHLEVDHGAIAEIEVTVPVETLSNKWYLNSIDLLVDHIADHRVGATIDQLLILFYKEAI